MAGFILKVRNLTKTYKDRIAVNDISFEIFKGEIFGFLGPNGAGKTTTLKIIAGLAKPTSGVVKICGFDVTTQFEKAVSNIGGIIENPVLYPYMSGLANLKYYASLFPNISEEKIHQTLKLVGMEARAKDKVKTYSLGMRQRIGIAQALLHDPKLLVLDEPTNGLDPAGIIEMRNFLKDLAHNKDISIIISSHILSEMEQLCDTIAIIDEGKIIEVKTMKEIKKIAEDQSKVQIIVNYPNYAGKIVMNKYKRTVELAGNTIIFSAKKEEVPKITNVLIQKGLSIYGIKNTTKNLEEVFLDLIRKNKQKKPSVAIF